MQKYRFCSHGLLLWLAVLGISFDAQAEPDALRQRVLTALAIPSTGLPGNHYLLRRTDAVSGAIRYSEYWLDFPRHRLMRRDLGYDDKNNQDNTSQDNTSQDKTSQNASVLIWASASEGWREQGGIRTCLTAAERERALASLRYHFYYLFTQAETVVTAQTPTRWQVRSPLVDAFMIEVDAADRIIALDFDNGRRGKEHDYRLVNGVWWPFQFAISDQDKPILHGEFSQFAIRSVAAELDDANQQRLCVAAPAAP